MAKEDQHMIVAGVRRTWRPNPALLVLLLVPLLIGGLALLLMQQVVRADRLNHEEQQSQDRRAFIQSVLAAHQDLETGQRGYLITGRESFLEPYEAGQRNLAQSFVQLRKIYAGDAARLREIGLIEALSHEKRAFSARSIDARRRGDAETASAMVVSGHGKALMDEIRKHIDILLTFEVERLRGIAADSGRAIEGFRALSYAFLAILTLILAVAAYVISRTLKSRNEALDALEDVSRRRKAILDAAMDAIITLNPSGTIEGLNAAALRMFGYSDGELLRRDVGILFASTPPPGVVASQLREMNLVEGEPGALKEISAQRKDGTTFPADAAFTLSKLAEGLRYVAVIRDISERHRVDRMKAEFVSTVSHELRTPLSSIAGSLGLLAGGAAGPLADKAARLVTIARNNAERLVRLINDILDIEKLEFGSMVFNNEPLDLNVLAAEALEANRGYADSFEVRMELTQAERPAIVLGDRDRIAQVLANLLSNAIKFSPKSGTVQLNVSAGDSTHAISIRDFGPGIPDEFRGRIFGKFAQADSSDNRKKGGTGLGLSIVREIATRLGGTIGFESEPGAGACFNVALPALEPSLVRGRVLVCGEPGSAIRDALASTQLSAVFEESSAAALERVAKEPFTAILVDMGLDDGAGIAVLRAARAGRCNAVTPVLAIGGSPVKRGAQTDAALIVDWLRKPGDLAATLSPQGLRKDLSSTAAGPLPRVLHVDDDPDILRIVSAALEGQADVTCAESIAAARDCLARTKFDLLIIDLTLGDGAGTELLPDVLRTGENPIPVLIFSAEDADPQTASQVDAFLTKSRTPMSKLVQVIERLAEPGRKSEKFL
jgi:PAS domain S-box-containing protein